MRGNVGFHLAVRRFNRNNLGYMASHFNKVEFTLMRYFVAYRGSSQREPVRPRHGDNLVSIVNIEEIIFYNPH